MSTACPSCRAESAGRFCSTCGVAVNATCRDCANPLPAGARFCNMCGVTVAAQASSGRKVALPWAMAGISGVVAAGLAFMLLSQPDVAAVQQTAGVAAPFAGPAAGGATGGDPTQVDLSSMSPREAADRLFNRVMTAAANGDTAQAQQFAPMAIQAYGMVSEPNHDLRYHVGELYRITGDAAGTRAQADAILAEDPEHLFGLFLAGSAAQMAGKRDEAAGFFRKFVDGYAAQVARNLPEYTEHQQGLPGLRAAAEEALAAK